MATASTSPHRARNGRRSEGDVSDQVLRPLAEVFKILGDASRLKILIGLSQKGAMNVTSLRELLQETQETISQPAVSHHLALLRSARLVRGDRQGKQCFYQLESSSVRDLLEQFFAEMGNSSRQVHLDDLTLSLRRR